MKNVVGVLLSSITLSNFMPFVCLCMCVCACVRVCGATLWAHTNILHIYCMALAFMCYEQISRINSNSPLYPDENSILNGNMRQCWITTKKKKLFIYHTMNVFLYNTRVMCVSIQHSNVCMLYPNVRSIHYLLSVSHE